MAQHVEESDLDKLIQVYQSRTDENALLAVFKEFADMDDQTHMSRSGLEKALNALRIKKDSDELDEFMMHIDENNDGKLDEHEFLSAIRTKSQLELLLNGLPVVHVLADVLASARKGDPLAVFLGMNDADVDHAVAKASSLIAAMLKHARAVLAPVSQSKQPGRQGEKFAAVLMGGDVSDFHRGRRSRLPTPCHQDETVGMEMEHLRSRDAGMPFTTGNYGITTTPSQEYKLVTSGGEGYEDLPAEARNGKGEERVIRKMEEYKEYNAVGQEGQAH